MEPQRKSAATRGQAVADAVRKSMFTVRPWGQFTIDIGASRFGWVDDCFVLFAFAWGCVCHASNLGRGGGAESAGILPPSVQRPRGRGCAAVHREYELSAMHLGMSSTTSALCLAWLAAGSHP
eukprot:4033049-Prymnesium_polylepis.1